MPKHGKGLNSGNLLQLQRNRRRTSARGTLCPPCRTRAAIRRSVDWSARLCKIAGDLMKLIQLLFPVALLAPLCEAKAASPGNAPPLPVTGTRIVNVATEPQLQTAMDNLQNGDTLLLAEGTYNLTTSLDNTTPYFDHAGGVVR